MAATLAGLLAAASLVACSAATVIRLDVDVLSTMPAEDRSGELPAIDGERRIPEEEGAELAAFGLGDALERFSFTIAGTFASDDPEHGVTASLQLFLSASEAPFDSEPVQQITVEVPAGSEVPFALEFTAEEGDALLATLAEPGARFGVLLTVQAGEEVPLGTLIRYELTELALSVSAKPGALIGL